MTTATAIGRPLPPKPWQPGQSGNPSGRKPLPAWFRDGAEDCLRVLLACATGRTQAGDPPAAAQVAAEATSKERLQAAEAVANRVLGKAPELLQVDGGSAVMDLLVAMAKPVNPAPDDP